MAAVAEEVPIGTASAEMRLLVRLARLRLEPGDRAALTDALGDGLDWDRVRFLARLHKLAPLSYHHLRGYARLVPPDALGQMARQYFANAQVVMELTRELIAIIRELAARGVLCVPYKGAALAAQAYGNLVLRPAGDLDVVVRKRDLPEVRALLSARGFRRQHDLSGAGDDLMVRSLYHEVFRRADGCTVEVHWGFTDKNPFFWDLEALEPRLTPVSLGGEDVLGFSREDQLLLLSVHGAKHRWIKLEWITGIAELLRAPGPIDWSSLLRRADEVRSRRVLLLGLRVAHEVLDAPLPPEILRLSRADPVVGRLTFESKQLLFTTSDLWRDLDVAPRDIFYLRLADRPLDKLRYLLHRLTTPSQAKSWRGIALGRVYLPFHSLLRPFRSPRILRLVARWIFRRGR